MNSEHRCICATCSRDMKPGGHSAPVAVLSNLSSKTETAPKVPPVSAIGGWEGVLREWAKIIVKFAYLVLEIIKMIT